MILNKNVKDKVDKIALKYELFLMQNKIASKKSWLYNFDLKFITTIGINAVFSLTLWFSLYDTPAQTFLDWWTVITVLGGLSAMLAYIFLSLVFDENKFVLKLRKIRNVFLFKSQINTPLKMKIYKNHQVFNKENEKLYNDFNDTMTKDEKSIFNSFLTIGNKKLKFNKDNAINKYLSYYIKRNNNDDLINKKEDLLFLISELKNNESKNLLTGMLVNKINLIENKLKIKNINIVSV